MLLRSNMKANEPRKRNWLQQLHSNPQLIWRLLRYGLVGILATVVHYLLLWTLVEWVHLSVLIATSIAFLFVTIENYLLHYVWTFASSNSHHSTFPRFLLMNLIGFWINWGVMYLGMQQSMNYLITQAVAIIAVVIWNFLLSSLWIFRERNVTVH